MSDVHVASLTAKAPTVSAHGGSITELTAADLPILAGLSLHRVVLAPGTAREPHWTVRGRQLGYGIRGRALVTIAGNGSEFEQFTVGKGECFFVPEAWMVSVENTGDEPFEAIVATSDESPESFGMSSSLGFMTDAVIGNTFGFSADALAGRPHGSGSRAIVVVDDPDAPAPDPAQHSSPYWFDVEHAPFVGNPEIGGAYEAKKMFWPVVTGMSMFSLYVTPDGMRESHWHPVTAEMGYIAKGNARMSVLDPDGSWDTYELKAGDVYFIPRSYPHMIEDTGDDEFHFLIFFDQETSGDIGYRVAMDGLRPALAAAVFGLPVDQLPTLPPTRNDPQFVARVNPVDPVTG